MAGGAGQMQFASGLLEYGLRLLGSASGCWVSSATSSQKTSPGLALVLETK